MEGHILAGLEIRNTFHNPDNRGSRVKLFLFEYEKPIVLCCEASLSVNVFRFLFKGRTHIDG